MHIITQIQLTAFTCTFPLAFKNDNPSGNCPDLICGIEKVALSEAKTRSNKGRIETPSPLHAPSTPQINNFGNAAIAIKQFLNKKYHNEVKIFELIFIILTSMLLPSHSLLAYACQ